MKKLILLVIGVLLSSLGLCYIFLYLNLLTMGYSFFEFVYFISRRIECYLFFIGLGIILFTTKGWIKHELLLRHRIKF